MKRASRGILSPRLPARLDEADFDRLADGDLAAQVRLTGQDFSGQKAARLGFEEVHLRRALFVQTRFLRPRLLDARLEACDLSAAAWEEAHLTRVEWLGCKLLAADLAHSQFEDVLYRECNLEKARFDLSTFKSARFEHCNLQGAGFTGCDLSGVSFAGSDLSGADLREARLAGADLRSANISGVQVGAKELQGAIISPRQAEQVAALLGVIVREEDEVL